MELPYDNNRHSRPKGRGISCGLLLFGTEDVVSTRTVMSPHQPCKAADW